jgi:hypothetical protein
MRTLQKRECFGGVLTTNPRLILLLRAGAIDARDADDVIDAVGVLDSRACGEESAEMERGSELIVLEDRFEERLIRAEYAPAQRADLRGRKRDDVVRVS